MQRRKEEEEQRRLLLAEAQQHLVLLSCHCLASLTVCTNAEFLSIARRGRTPPRPTPHTTDGGRNKGKKPHSEADEADIPLDARRDAFAMHEEAYRSVRSAIAASCTLGHRSCHALWGPKGCGKHRILRLVAKDCAQRGGTFVLSLDGDMLNSDEDALHVIAQQMLRFLQSRDSAELRAADASIRTGTFDFGKLFCFDKVIGKEEKEDDDDNDGEGEGGEGENGPNDASGEEHPKGKAGSKGAKTSTCRGTKRKAQTTHPKRTRRRVSLSESSNNDSESDSDEDQTREARLFITSTTAAISGGAASALPALQRVLLRMKSCGTNLVVCIRRVERFGVWCDQLLYVLSGLMHEADGRGGGMSLVMTSSTPDIRQLEKRLSSRLTCETRCIPLLPWTARRVARVVLMEAQHQLRLQCETTEDTPATAQTSPHVGESHAQAEETDSTPSRAAHALMYPFPSWRAMPLPMSSSVRRRASRCATAALLLAEEVLSELHAADASAGPDTFAAALHADTLHERASGARAGRVVSNVSRLLAACASGRLALLSRRGRAAVWERLLTESRRAAPVVTHEAPCTPVPPAVWAVWCDTSRRAKATPPANAEAALAGVEDTAWDAQLLELGYASREALLVLVYAFLRHEGGVRRTVADLMEDIASSLGTRAAAALDRGAFRTAIAALHRWRVLSLSGSEGDGSVVAIRGSAARMREFLRETLRRTEWCETVAGLDAKELMRLRSLV